MGSSESTGPSQVTPRVQMRGIVKRFGGLAALDGVDLVALGGEVHALLGENGAGKTTLMNILSGLYRADQGEIRITGRPIRIAAPRDALRHGIGMVHQRVELVPHLSVLENILLGQEGSRCWLRMDRQRERIQVLAQRLGLAMDWRTPVQSLGVGLQQKVEILRVLYRGATILILDEPTTMLTSQETDAFLETMRSFAGQGLTVLFITHKIREVLTVCDRITVLRSGRLVGSVERREATEAALVTMMMGGRGRSAREELPRDGPRAGIPILTVRGLTVTAPDGIRLVDESSFTVRSGETVGLAGVSGNGQRELAEAVVGLRPIATGAVELEGFDISREPIRERIARGLLYVPEDRIRDGLLPTQGVAENLYFAFRAGGQVRRFWYHPAEVRALAREVMAEYGIVVPSEHAPAANLSGGNIQRLLVARIMTLAARARLKALIALHPSQGLDVLATEFVHGRLRAFREAGGGILLVSSDLDELMALCDRILVMYRGRVVGEGVRGAYDPLQIGRLMAGLGNGAGS